VKHPAIAAAILLFFGLARSWSDHPQALAASDPCQLLSSAVASSVLKGPAALDPLSQPGRCNWDLRSDPNTFIQYTITHASTFGVNQRAPHQLIAGLGDSAVWYLVPGNYQLDVSAKGSAISVQIYRPQRGFAVAANDLAGCKAVALDLIKHL
jgi:hypothetical protein